MSKTLHVIFALLIGQWLTGQSWQSQLVWENQEGFLQYSACPDGFVIPDFSHAGYKGGGVEIPVASVVRTIEPVEGDNTAHIQDAINQVGVRPLNAQGLRGAVLLKAGTYEVNGTIRIPFSGVVLRGEGDEAEPASNTIIIAKGNSPHQRDVMLVGNSTKSNWNSRIVGSESNIINDFVPVGARSFDVANPALYAVGDQIIIYHPCSQEWLEAVDFGGVNDPTELWSVNQFPIVFNRYITQISNNTITVDAPVFNTLNRALSQSYIYKPNMNGTVYNVGIENLRINIETLGGEDENHAWQAVRFKSCENAWALNCTFAHFGQSGIITEATSRSTFRNCRAVDPVAIITGERMYNFNTYHFSQLNLFEDCYARNGRHNYISNGTSTTSGNVFLNCVSDGAYSVSEGHRHWTTGMLFDNYRETNLRREFVLGLYNRVDAGTGHGWSAAFSVLWNCDVTAGGVIALQKPPTAQNYAIGCIAKRITGNPHSNSDFPLGYVEGTNQTGLYPQSLYNAQLFDRTRTVSSVGSVKSNLPVEVYYNRQSNLLVVNDYGVFSGGEVQYQLFDVAGRLIRIGIFDSSQNAIRLDTALVPGVYLLRFWDRQQVQTLKIALK